MHSNFGSSTLILAPVIHAKVVKTKAIFRLGWIRALGCVVVFFIIVETSYQTHVFWGFVSNIIRAIKFGVDQVYSGGQGTSFWLTWLLVATISSSSLRFQTKALDIYFCQGSVLNISQIIFFFLWSLEVLSFLLGLKLFQQQVSIFQIPVEDWSTALDSASMALSIISS